MKNNNTESNLRKAAQDQLANPPSFVWDNIETELQPKESKRRVGLWWFGSVLVALLVITIWATLGTDTMSSIPDIAITDIAITDIANTDRTKQEENTSTNKESVLASSIANITNEIALDDANSPQPQSNTTQQQQQQQQQLTSSKLSILNSNHDHNDDHNTIGLATSESYSNSHHPIPKTITNKDSQDQTNDVLSSVNTNTEKVNKENRTSIISQFLTVLKLENLKYDRPVLPSHTCTKYDSKIELKPFVEFGVLSGVHSMSLYPNNNIPLYNRRKETESSWYSTGLYSNFGLNISQNWHVSMGAEWTMSKDKFESKSEGITKMIVTFDPTSGSAIDTSFISGTIYNKGDITFHFIDIPISLGYTRSNENWVYGIELTGLLNIKTITEGKAYNDTEGIISIKNENNIYKNSIGLGVKFSLLIARKLGRNYSVQLRPSYKTYLNTINNENYPLSIKYGILSVSIGLKKEF